MCSSIQCMVMCTFAHCVIPALQRTLYSFRQCGLTTPHIYLSCNPGNLLKASKSNTLNLGVKSFGVNNRFTIMQRVF